MSAKGGLSQASGDEIYEVERLIRRRHHPSRGVEYLVKWRNFPSSANTWEPVCNFSQKLLELYEAKRSKKSKKSNCKSNPGTSTSSPSTATIARTSTTPDTSSSRLSTTSSEDTEIEIDTEVETSRTSTEKRKAKSPKESLKKQRQQQVQLQLDIQKKQKTQVPIERQQMAVFNPVGNHHLPVVEEVVYEPELTKEPIIVTDVTTRHQTVTISECLAREGFFSIK